MYRPLGNSVDVDFERVEPRLVHRTFPPKTAHKLPCLCSELFLEFQLSTLPSVILQNNPYFQFYVKSWTVWGLYLYQLLIKPLGPSCSAQIDPRRLQPTSNCNLNLIMHHLSILKFNFCATLMEQELVNYDCSYGSNLCNAHINNELNIQYHHFHIFKKSHSIICLGQFFKLKLTPFLRLTSVS